MFTPIDQNPDFPSLERQILDFWEKNKIREKYLAKNQNSSQNFSFLDGPITANNPMGVHHAWGRTYKDVFQRFHNMLGHKQRFQNGFDCQGLWVEVEVEKELGFKSKKDIESYGIAKFVQACKDRALKYAAIQTRQSQRLGYFMDWGNDYFTMSDENNYGIWNFLKLCWERGFLYKGRDSVPWCPRCGTAISQHEISTEEYGELEHESVYLRFPLVKDNGDNYLEGANRVYLLVWTTTPWTLPANISVAVNPDLDYVFVSALSLGGGSFDAFNNEGKTYGSDDKIYIIAKDRLPNIAAVEVIKTVKGSELAALGLRYSAPFDHLPRVKQEAEKGNFHTVIASAEYVNAQEGTGLVHIAPGCGAEDFEMGKENNLPILDIIDESAAYLEGLGNFSGQNAKKHPEIILDFLKEEKKDFFVAAQPYTHRYPKCWRCQEELVWRVVDEWYIAMDRPDSSDGQKRTLREQIISSTKQVEKWMPDSGLARELDWLENMRDWLISKKRYWGLALPIWECSCGYFKVIGSKEELQQTASEGWNQFSGHSPHRPYVDDVKIKCLECGQIMSRVLDVGNPWLDAGIVAFSTLGYFQDRQYWQKWFPADLITESFPGQFRNWFYSLLTMSTVLERKAPFKVLVGHALVKDEHGQEMHKSKGNAIWFDDAAEKMGADVMRWLYCRQNPVLDLNFGYTPANHVRRQFFLILWNCYKFFITYANIDGFVPKDSSSPVQNGLDNWLLSRFNSLNELVLEAISGYDLPKASQALEDFVINDLSTWYIRLSRDRVGPTVPSQSDKDGFYNTSYYVLLNLTKLLAPFIPFLSEYLWQNLRIESSSLSVHLEPWFSGHSLRNTDLEEAMSLLRFLVEQGRAERSNCGIKLRQPLASAAITTRAAIIEKLSSELIAYLRKELNVKEIIFKESAEVEAITFDTVLTDQLVKEGRLREVIREIQSARKELGCSFDAKVEVTYPDSWKDLADEFGSQIKRQALVKSLILGETLKVSSI